MPTIKERLRIAAIQLFAKHGYSITTVDQICSVAKVSKGAFYYHFGSKDAALYGIYQPLQELQTQRLQEIIAQPLPTAEKLQAVAENVVRTCLERIEDLTIFMQSIHLLEPETRALVSAQRRSYHETFVALIQEGQREGVLRSDLHPDLLINQLFGPIHYSTMWYQKDGKFLPDELARSFADMWLNGIRIAGYQP
jgi:AcrR family transcriptional regulator